jgi:hypothetical protein
MAKAKNNITLLTPMFRMSFPQLIEPKAFVRAGKPQGEPKFSVTMIFDPESLKNFQKQDPNDPNKLVNVDVSQVVAELARAEWEGIKLNADTKSGGMADTWPIINGDTYAAKQEAKGKKGDAYKGKKLITAKTGVEYPPTLRLVVDGKVEKLSRALDKHMAMAKAAFVGGHYAVAEVTLSPTELDGERYVPFYLNNVRFVKEGERFGGQSLMDRFGGTEGGTEARDPTAGMDDEIPV